MAKEVFQKGDTVRLTRKLEFGTVKIRPATQGTIKQVKKGLFKTGYVVRWQGLNFDVTMLDSKQFVLAQNMSGDVHK
jgi:hypothetical protein